MDSFSKKNFNPNKHLKEQFVSNLDGTSMLEIAALSTIVPVVVLLRHAISSYRTTGSGAKDIQSKKTDSPFVASQSWRVYFTAVTSDFLLILLPTLLFLTVLAEWTYWSTVLLTLLLALCVMSRRFGSFLPRKKVSDSVRTYVSLYRVSMMIVTCLCILAVDFKIFPRRYAKTETYGISLMDIGVGSFVLANSLVSRQARSFSSMNLKTAIRTTSPLILLGFGRLVSTAGVNYQVHVGEYGVHWNFFFTLAAVAILSSLVNIPPRYCGILGVLITAGYQICLLRGLNLYLLSNEREPNIISQNKEGIFSIFGYWGLYLIGVQLGNYLFFGTPESNTFERRTWTRTRVWILTLIFWLLTFLLDKYVERVSRRMCNLSYVTLVLSQNFQVLSILTLSDYVPGSASSALEDAINRNLLGSFLLANVLTGVVNLFVDTLFSPPVTALFILSLYAYILSISAGLLDFYSLSRGRGGHMDFAAVSDRLDHLSKCSSSFHHIALPFFLRQSSSDKVMRGCQDSYVTDLHVSKASPFSSSSRGRYIARCLPSLRGLSTVPLMASS